MFSRAVIPKDSDHVNMDDSVKRCRPTESQGFMTMGMRLHALSQILWNELKIISIMPVIVPI